MGLSRVEDILQAGLDGTEMPKALSRVEILLEEWIEASGGASSDAYATAISLTIDSSTYIMTAQLLNKDGDPIGNAQTIDLPLESMVVSGSYDSLTKKVILTLKNGQTVEFSIADLVDGLASQADLDALTARVGTNENNILLVANQSVNYNVFDIANTTVTPSTGASVVKTNNTITVTSTSGNAYAHGEIYIQNFKAGTYYFSCKVDSLIGQDEKHILVRETIPTGNLLLNLIVSATGTIYGEFTVSSDITLFIGVYSCYTSNSDDEISISDIAIIPKSVWDAGFTNYQPYALSNAELTTKEKQNENNISTIQQTIGDINTVLEGVL